MSAAANDLVAALEGAVGQLGRETRKLHPDWYAARFAEIYDGGLDAFGRLGPSPDEELDAQLWFLLDCPLPDGRSPLTLLKKGAAVGAAELLARSELRAWRVESLGQDGQLTALCPLGTGPAVLECVRPPAGELKPGAFLVARTVLIGSKRRALLGRIPVVDGAVAGEFERLLASLDAPRGELWRVHGGVVARAAWAWPEWHETTIDGETVQICRVALELNDARAGGEQLASQPEFEVTVEGEAAWRWTWDPPTEREPPAALGVRYELSGDALDPNPALAYVEVEPGLRRLWLMAVTPGRLSLAERLLRERLGALIGEERHRDLQPPEVTPRWKRDRWDRAAAMGAKSEPVPQAA